MFGNQEPPGPGVSVACAVAISMKSMIASTKAERFPRSARDGGGGVRVRLEVRGLRSDAASRRLEAVIGVSFALMVGPTKRGGGESAVLGFRNEGHRSSGAGSTLRHLYLDLLRPGALALRHVDGEHPFFEVCLHLLGIDRIRQREAP